MNFYRLKIPELIVFEPAIFNDERGFFYESFNQKRFNEIVGEEICFVQDNHSFSDKNVLRGLHYQLPPFGQGKLVRVIKGEVLDIAVDLRESSPTFGMWESVLINDELKNQFWIPEGFGHGFLVLSESAHFLYKTTNYYDKDSEASIIWNDDTLNINWQIGKPLVSEKDSNASKFTEAEKFK